MARSIHATWQKLKRLKREDYADPTAKAKKLRAMRAQLRRKRLLKHYVRQERHLLEPPLEGTSPETIPIRVIPSGSAHVHHPLGPDDLRSLLLALPAAATHGITEIQLSLGKEYLEENARKQGDIADDRRDPWTGRLGSELWKGLYAPDFLGTYTPSSGRIEIYAYVYNAAVLPDLPSPPAAQRAYLRLLALKTFIHEVAHHHDEAQRIARGRWLSDRKKNAERYADRMEQMWTQEIGLAWLENRFPEEVAALLDWIEEFGGLRIPLCKLAGRRYGSIFKLSSAFAWFVQELAEKPQPVLPSRDTYLAFAWELHYADEYAYCFRLIECILAESPAWRPARVCRADTLVHLERYDEARREAHQILQIDGACSEAWCVLADCAEAQEQWMELLATCHAWEATAPHMERVDRYELFIYRAVACCALDRLNEMEQWIARRWEESSTACRSAITRNVYRRAGKALKETRSG